VYNSGGECGRASKSKRDASGTSLPAVKQEYRDHHHRRMKCYVRNGSTFGDCAETIPLQQS